MFLVKENKPVNILIANPTIFAIVRDQSPLATSWHFRLVTKNSIEYHSILIAWIFSKVVNERMDSLSFHNLLNFDCLTSNCLLSKLFFLLTQLLLQNLMCCGLLSLKQELLDFEHFLGELLSGDTAKHLLTVIDNSLSHTRIVAQVNRGKTFGSPHSLDQSKNHEFGQSCRCQI